MCTVTDSHKHIHIQLHWPVNMCIIKAYLNMSHTHINANRHTHIVVHVRTHAHTHTHTHALPATPSHSERIRVLIAFLCQFIYLWALCESSFTRSAKFQFQESENAFTSKDFPGISIDWQWICLANRFKDVLSLVEVEAGQLIAQTQSIVKTYDA